MWQLMQRLPEIAENCGIENAVVLETNTTAIKIESFIVIVEIS
jgi:hypothetical protein